MRDGMFYAPKGKPQPVVKSGEFKIAAIGLDHGHIYGMCNGLTEAGAEIKWVYDPDPAKVEQFRKSFPQAQAADSRSRCSRSRGTVSGQCHIPSGAVHWAWKLWAGKDYFVDKGPFTTLEQLEQARAKVKETGRK